MYDAEVAIMCLGSTAGTAKTVAKNLRTKGLKVGVIKPWLYRPFPSKDLQNTIKDLKALAVMDKACSFGGLYGPLCSDIASMLHQNGTSLKLLNRVYGLGGRDITPMEIEEIFKETVQVAETGIVKEPVKFVGVRK
jgi:pyruvate ferredoxin oxidoreductase alpha subunit